MYAPSSSRILIIDGPNLNLTGRRQPEIYGTATTADMLAMLAEQLPTVEAEYFQSNCEGAIVDRLQQAWLDDKTYAGIVINAGAYSHYSLAIADAIAASDIPTVEVHISNIFARGPERSRSVISPVCKAVVAGLGLQGYVLAAASLTASQACKK